MQKTLVFIKPDAIDSADKILAELDLVGKRTHTAHVAKVPKETIEEHYSAHRGKYFFSYVTGSFIGQPMVLAVYEGPDVIEKIKEACGATDPQKAAPHTIRNKYSNDSLEVAISELRPVRNAVHRSDSEEEFKREMKVWEEFFKHPTKK